MLECEMNCRRRMPSRERICGIHLYGETEMGNALRITGNVALCQRRRVTLRSVDDSGVEKTLLML